MNHIYWLGSFANEAPFISPPSSSPEDQPQALAWKYLIPISLLNIMVTAVLKVAF